MTVYVSLLRAVNVGGHNKIKMGALRELYESLGLSRVQTLLQSGNVVFAAKESNRKRLVGRLEDAIEQALGCRPEVLLRSAAELRDVVERAPFPEARQADPSHLLVMFLASRPDKAAQQRLTAKHHGPEAIAFSGEELYVHYSAGIGRSKLTNALIEKQLQTTGTARNWNTVTKLLEMTEQD